MSNRLARENSPYLLQHADNPVDWYPWGDEALEKARREDKPIFLSIGYAACHWCHVMAHESFEDPDTAAILNEHFVNIKVDREERPDIDSIYMNAVVAMSGHGGWPLSVFLTPDGRPFFGGTYFPAQRRYNLPSFREILLTIARLWHHDRQQLLQSAAEITQHVIQHQITLSPSKSHLEPPLLDQAAFRLAQAYDWKNGGWGSAPKFPQPMAIEFLLGRAARGDRFALDIALHALQAMARGGMYDIIGGGFARYSTDEHWMVPHFEKMLYDNAQLARVYLHAYLLTQKEHYRQVCCETLDFIRRELGMPVNHQGQSQIAFASSLDADSEGEEGKFYTWSAHEIESALADFSPSIPLPHPSGGWVEVFMQAYGITAQGNFEGKNVLQRQKEDETLAAQFSLPLEHIPQLLQEMRNHLFKWRAGRVRPALDDKAITSWNALALIAFAEAARYLQRKDYLQIAQANANFLLTHLKRGGKLLRSWRQGRADHRAYLEDIAALTLALLSLYQSDFHHQWYQAALLLVEEMLTDYQDSRGGFFDTPVDLSTPLLRPKDLQDNATPSGNALAALALLQASVLEGREDWRVLAEEVLVGVQGLVGRYPLFFSKWLCAIDFALQPIKEIAILGDSNHTLTQEMLAIVRQEFHPFYMVAYSPYPPSPQAPALLKDRPLLNNLPTAYVCYRFACQQPVNDPLALRQQLHKSRHKSTV